MTRSYAVAAGDRTDHPAIDAIDAARRRCARTAGRARSIARPRVGRPFAPRGPARAGRRRRAPGDPLRGQRALRRGRARRGARARHRDRSHRVAPGRADPRFYQKRAFLDAEVTPEVRGEDRDPVQVLLFHVVEHARVKVTARRYPCLKRDAIHHLSNGGPRSAAEIGTKSRAFSTRSCPARTSWWRRTLAGCRPRSAPAADRSRRAPAPCRSTCVRTRRSSPRPTSARSPRAGALRNEGFLHALVGPRAGDPSPP